MINIERIWAIILRHLLLTFRNMERILSVFYWPLLNIVIWGITSIWLQEQAQQSNIITMILTGLIFWQIVFRVNLETAKSLFDELLNQNLINLFATPLTPLDWIVAIMLLGILNMILVLAIGIIAVWFIYGINIFILGWSIIPCMLLLLLSGWAIGFFVCGLLITWGVKAQDLIFTVGWLFAPFSAIYYPVSILPKWMQAIASVLPTTYVFEIMRGLLNHKPFSYSLMGKSLILNILYLSCALLFFKYMFEKSKDKGLARLE